MSIRSRQRRGSSPAKQRRGLLSGIFESLFPRGKDEASRDAGKRSFAHEQLEDRRMLVVGAFEIPPTINPGEGFDGVVGMDFGTISTPTILDNGCTASLLSTGRHVITAAHCTDFNLDGAPDFGTASMVFDMPNQNYVIPVTTGGTSVPGAWDGNVLLGNDIAIIELPFLAPFPAERYEIFRGAGENGTRFTQAGYGNTGTGSTGSLPGPSTGTKRMGHNEFVTNVAPFPGSILFADFDNGTAGLNILGDSLGLDLSETTGAQGDSGSPAFVGGPFIAGLNSFSLEQTGDGLRDSFGDVNGWTRVSSFTGFVDGILNAPDDIVLNMNFQPAGNDGVPDDIVYRVDPNDGTRVQLLIGTQEIWSAPASRVTSVSVIGSGDDDNFTIDTFFGDPTTVGPVSFNGSDPTASDTVTVIGTINNDVITISPNGSDNVSIFGLANNITATEVEHVLYDGFGGNDNLFIDTFNSDGTIVLAPAVANDAGTIEFQDNNLSNFIAPSITFQRLGQVGDLSFTDAGRFDDLLYRGTDTPDLFRVDSTGQVFLNSRIPVATPGIVGLLLTGLDGDDEFRIAGDHNLIFVSVDGGNPSSSDTVVVELTAASSGAVVDLQSGTVTPSAAGLIGVNGVENVVVDGDDGVANAFTVANYGYSSASGINTLTLNGGDTNNNDGDTVNIATGVNSNDTIQFFPERRDKASIKRVEGGPEILLRGMNDAGGSLFVNLDGGIDAIEVHGTASNDQFTVQRRTLNSSNSRVFTTVGVGTPDAESTIVLETTGTTERLVVAGGAGNDLLRINENNGLIDQTQFPSGILYHGGSGNDTLEAIGAAAVTATYTVGPAVDEGELVHVSGVNTQRVQFTGLEPVLDTVPGTLTVFGTNADNAITLSNGASPATGLVAVDNFETIEFSNKTTLTIDGRAGSDNISVELSTPPTALTDITVNGSGPSGSDTLIVQAVAGVFDPMIVEPSAQGAGVVFNFSGAIPPVTFGGIEHLRLVGQLADGDPMGVDGTIGDDVLNYTPGATPDSGTVTGTMDQTNATGSGPFPLVPISFSGMSQASVLVYNAFGQVGGTDTFVYNGLDVDDTIRVSSAAPGALFVTNTIANQTYSNLIVANISAATIRGNGGDDQITVTPDIDIPLVVEGGSPGDSDRLLVDETGGTLINNGQFVVQPDFSNMSPNAGMVEVYDLGGNQLFGLQYRGIELLQLMASTDDDLRFADDLGDNTWRIGAGPAVILESVRAQIDNRTPVDFEAFDRVLFENSGGVDRFIVSPDRMPTSMTYIVDGLLPQPPATPVPRDTLEIVGTGFGDTVVATNTAVSLGASINYLELAHINVNTLEGDDLVQVDSTFGYVTTPLSVDGGTGHDGLQVTGLPVSQVTYNVGPNSDEGQLIYTVAGIGDPVALIDFTDLEPIEDNVPAALIVINGNGANNQFSVDQGPAGNFFNPIPLNVVTARVAVDNYETYEFSDKQQLVMNGQGGSDTISLNSSVTPTGMLVGPATGIVVNGNDPTADSDRLIVNGVARTVTVRTAAQTIDGVFGTLGAVRVGYNTVEGITVNAGAASVLDVQEASAYIHSAATATDEAELLADNFPISYTGFGLGATIALSSPNAGYLTMNGTNGADDYVVQPNGAPNAQIVTNGRATINTAGIDRLTINSLDGDDSFVVNGGAIFSDGIEIEAGNPSASDVVFLNGTAGNDNIALAISPGSDDTVTGIVGGDITLQSVEILAISALGGTDTMSVTNLGGFSSLQAAQFVGDASDTMTIEGTPFDDSFDVTPHLIDAGTDLIETRVNDRGPTVYSVLFGAPATAFLVDGVLGSDNLTVHGTELADVIAVSGTAVAVSNTRQVNYANFDSLGVVGGAGADTFNVTPAAIPIFIDGSDPVAVLPGDAINIDAGAASVSYNAGPESDEGGINVAGSATVSYDHIESLALTGTNAAGQTVTVNGTNGDDYIKVVGEDVDDFSINVNAGAAILYVDFPNLVVDGQRGVDHIEVEVNNLALRSFRAIGSNPSIQGMGDLLTVEPWSPTVQPLPNDAVSWSPSLFDAGLLTVNTQAIQVETMEQVVYDGQLRNTAFTVNGTGNADTIVHTPGNAVDSGTVQVNSLLPISYVTLGGTGTVTVDGGADSDMVVARGTGGDDFMQVLAGNGSVTLTSVHGTHVLLQRIDAAAEGLTLDALDGNDVFQVDLPQPHARVSVLGGGPGGSDVLRVAAEFGVPDAITVSPGLVPNAGNIGANGVLDIPYVGIEDIILLGNADAGDALTVTDDLADNHWVVKAGRVGDFILIDDRETLDYAGFETVNLVNLFGTDLFEVHPTDLTGFNTLTGSLIVNGDGDDKLDLVGTNNADTLLQVAPARFLVNVVPIDFAGVSTLQLTGGDGADTMSAGLSTLAGGVRELLVDGGGPSAAGGVVADELSLFSANNARVTQSTDAQSGTVDQASAVTVHYSTLESLNIRSLNAGSALTIRGTNDGEQIAIQPVAGNGNQGRVWIGSGTVMTFNTPTDSNFALVDLQGRFGDDHFSITPIQNVAIVAEGNDPTASDTAVINATADTTFAPTGSAAATVTVFAFAPVTLVTMEGVTIGGNDSGIQLTVATPAGAHTTTLTPGATPDSGDVQVSSLIPMNFTNLGAGLLTLDDAESAAINSLLADDTFVYRGTDVNDLFFIDSATGLVVLNNQIPVLAGDGAVLVVQGLNGDDRFQHLGGDAYFVVAIEGDGPDDGDVLDLFFPTGPIGVDLEFGAVTGYNATGTLFYSGLETVNVQAGGQALTVRATSVDDTLEVTPYGLNDGTLQNSGVDPVLNYAGVAANTLFVDLSTGDDTLVVNGSSTANRIAADVPAGTVDVDGGIVDFNTGAPDALTLNGQQGADSFTVTSGAIPVFVDGGDPIGQAGDTLTVVADSSALFLAGPESDEGGFTLDGGERVSYDHIEGVTVTDSTLPGDLVITVCGTNADDDITMIGTGAQGFTVSVNGGPAIQYLGAATLNIEGKSGDDDIELDLNTAALGTTVAIGVFGNTAAGQPGTDNDSVTVSGVDAASDSASFNPSADDAGTLTVVGFNPIGLSQVEDVTFDGESDGESLTVIGDTPFTLFTHIPGEAFDAGTFLVSDFLNGTLLGIRYANLGGGGSVTADGAASGTFDALALRGTQGYDAFEISFSGLDDIDVSLTNDVGNPHIPVRSVDVENYALDALDGDDEILVFVPGALTGTFGIEGGSPGAGSDTLELELDQADFAVAVDPSSGLSDNHVNILATDTVNATSTFFEVTGIELISFEGDGNDDLIVTPGQGDHTVRVDNGSSSDTDRVTSDMLPELNFDEIDVFAVTESGDGSVSLTFATRNLGGANRYLAALDDGDQLIIEGSAATDDFVVSTQGGQVLVTDNTSVNGVTVATTALPDLLVLNTLGGDDQVTVDETNGLVGPHVLFDGGSGSDRLIVTGTLPVEQIEYLPGPAVTEGRLTYDLDYLTLATKDMVIDFVNLEPVIDLVPTTVALTVYGTNADNAINYSGGPNSRTALVGGAVTGLVSVDAYETLEFSNKSDVLEIIALAGDDVVNLNYQDAAGLAPNGLQRIWVEGNDPTASDTVIVNGTTGADTINVSPQGTDNARITGVQAVARIDVFTSELLVVDGLGGGDSLDFITPAGRDSIALTPGAAPDDGLITSRELGGGTSHLPVSFTRLGAGGSVTFSDAGLPQVRDDILEVNGTPADDRFTVDAAGDVQVFRGHQPANIFTTVVLHTPGVGELELLGHDGDDVFEVAGNHPFNLAIVQGGNPGASDVLEFTSSGGATTVDLEASTVTELLFGPVIYSGIETIDLDAGGVTPTIAATGADEDITVTVFDATSGKVERGLAVRQLGQVVGNVEPPVVLYGNTGFDGLGIGNPVAINLRGGQDTLAVVGNALAQTINVNVATSTVSVDDLSDGGIDGRVTYSNNESLAVYGLEGDDTFDVTAGAIPLFVDGGDPIGQTAGDRFNMLAGGGIVTFEGGPESDEGGILIGSNARISFDHIEAGQVTDAECIVIMATNGDDDITIIARRELANPPRYLTADGKKDFTSTVNGGIEILWVNNDPNIPSVNLYVDAMSGDDDVVFRAPALDANGAPIAWSVNAWVVGGTPSAVTGDQGDVFELETPGTNRVEYQPLTSETGILRLDSANTGVLFDTVINLVANFVVDCDGDGVNEYASSDGGFESLVYDGETGNDVLTVLDLAGSDIVTHTPGVGRDEGTVRVNETLAIQYQNVGPNATLTLGAAAQGGRDTLVVLGTTLSDTFVADRVSAAIGRVALNNRLPIRTDGLETYTLDGLEGDDRFRIFAQLADDVSIVNANGGGPGASDVVEVQGTFGVADTISVVPGQTRTDGRIDVNLIDLNYTGVEHIQLVANNDAGDALTVQATAALGDNLWTVNAGDFSGDRVQIDNRETIEFRTFDTVALVNDFGTDRFRVYPTSLSQYLTSLTVTGGGGLIDDVLEIIGTPANDTVTSNADTVTLNGRRVTAGPRLVEVQVITLDGDDNIDLDLNLAGYRKLVDAGAGNDVVDVSGMQDATIFGGLGDDSITGSPLADLIYGGSGNDVIFGLGGNDTIYGDEGNDTITGGTGNDAMFGGDGSDRFIWNNGDNNDVVEGDEGVDVQIVNGAINLPNNGDAFELRTKTGDQTRAFFERTNFGLFTIDMGKVEQVDINGLAGADSIHIHDLYTTDVLQVNVDVGSQAETDSVTLEGRSTVDSVTLTARAGGVVNVAGLRYDVDVRNLNSVIDADTLTFNANEGDDVVVASDGLNAIFGTTLAQVDNLIINGGEGDDYLSGYGNLNGDAGKDLLVGGAFGQSINGGDGADQLFGGGGDDVLDGGAGEDLFVGGAGSDKIIGGDTLGNIEWDTILVSGTSAGDNIDIYQSTPSSLTHTVNGDAQTDTLGQLGDGTRTIDEVWVDVGAGADLIRTRIADAAVGSMAIDGVYNHLVTRVSGGSATGAGDRLVMMDDGADDLTIYRKGFDATEGNVTIGPANAEPYETVFDSIERVQFLDQETGAAVNQNPGEANRLVVFKFDTFEYNDDRFTATHLGAADQINVDPTIDPGAILDPFGDGMNVPGDDDWYRVQAVKTGTLDLQAFFEEIAAIPSSGRPGLPGAGNLDIFLYDVDGTLIAGNGPTFGGNDGAGANPELDVDGDSFNENERIRVPVVAGQVYYLRVAGVDDAINNYTLTIVNDAPPTPWGLELNDHVNFLAGAQEVPPVATNASGQVKFAYNSTTNTFNIDVFASGIELVDNTPLPQLTGAHIHVGAVGVNGGVIFNLGTGGWVQEESGIRLTLASQAFPAGNVADLLNNNTYVNLHTSANAGGEIRAQLTHILEMSDSGRTNEDNVTHDNTPTIYFRLDDGIFLYDQPGNDATDTPFDEIIPIPMNTQTISGPAGLQPGYRVAVFDEGPQPWAVNPQTPLGYATMIAPGVYTFTSPLLNDGSHFLTARVQMIDPATLLPNGNPATGWGARSQALEIVVDTIAPPVYFGYTQYADDGLHPDSDSGVESQNNLIVDRITSDTTPTVWGSAEANTVVRVYLDANNDGVINSGDFLLGKTVAIPTDGNNQFPNGQWTLTSNLDMNDPKIITALIANGVLNAGEIDGVRPLLVTAEDLAGNVSSASLADRLAIFIDSRGPQVDGVFVTNERDYDLFDPKPSTDGPTPLVWNLDIDFIDRPRRIGNTVLVGDNAVFVIDVSGSTFATFGGTPVGDPNNDGNPNTILDAEIAGFITLNQGLIDAGLGNTSLVGIVAFESSAYQLDMDPVAAGVQLTTTPLADTDANGVRDVDQALRQLTDLGGTDFEAGLQAAAATVNAVGNPANNNVVFMSDGFPNSFTYADEVATLNGLGVNLRAFGVGAGANLAALQIIDPNAAIFNTTDELLGFFQGAGGGGGGGNDVFLYPAVNEILATTAGNYLLKGDANGIIPIKSIEFLDNTVAGDVGKTTIRLNFYEPLPDDRYTLTVFDTITDDAGNALDGQDNTIEPQENPVFPSGDGVPGMDFVARFTVDTRPEIGDWANGTTYVDTNGNFIFDPQNLDYTNRDIQYVVEYKDPATGQITDKFFPSDNVFAGKFTGLNATTNDGFDRLAAYGKVGGVYRWLVDTDNNGVADLRVVDPAAVNGLPIAGNFDGDASNGDEVGVFTGTHWWLDTDHDYKLDTHFATVIVGLPIVGDFDGDGDDDLGTWTDDKFRFDLANNSFGQEDATIQLGFAGVRERPVAADMDMDGVDDVGLWVPDQSGQDPHERAEWFWLISNDYRSPAGAVNRVTGTVNTLNHAFTPVPFGKDVFAAYGDEYAIPIVGNFDPPVTPGGGGSDRDPLDVDGDGTVAPIDALIVINDLNGNGTVSASSPTSATIIMDVDRDGAIAPIDALMVINHLNSPGSAEGEGEGEDASLFDGAASEPVVAGSMQFSVMAGGYVASVAQDEEDDEEVVAVKPATVADLTDSLFADANDLDDLTATDRFAKEVLDSVEGDDADTDAYDWVFGQN